MEGIRNQDMQQILGAFAWETRAERYSLRNQLQRIRAVVSQSAVRMPSMDGILDNFHTETLRTQDSRRIYESIRTYMYGGGFLGGMRVTLRTEEEMDEFILKLTTAQMTRFSMLTQMGYISVITPEWIAPQFSMPDNQAQLEVFRDIYGADELRELVGMAPVGDETLICDLQIARYGDRWYAVSAGGLAFSLLGVSLEYQAFGSMTHMGFQ